MSAVRLGLSCPEKRALASDHPASTPVRATLVVLGVLALIAGGVALAGTLPIGTMGGVITCGAGFITLCLGSFLKLSKIKSSEDEDLDVAPRGAELPATATALKAGVLTETQNEAAERLRARLLEQGGLSEGCKEAIRVLPDWILHLCQEGNREGIDVSLGLFVVFSTIPPHPKLVVYGETIAFTLPVHLRHEENGTQHDIQLLFSHDKVRQNHRLKLIQTPSPSLRFGPSLLYEVFHGSTAPTIECPGEFLDHDTLQAPIEVLNRDLRGNFDEWIETKKRATIQLIWQLCSGHEVKLPEFAEGSYCLEPGYGSRPPYWDEREHWICTLGGASAS